MPVVVVPPSYVSVAPVEVIRAGTVVVPVEVSVETSALELSSRPARSPQRLATETSLARSLRLKPVPSTETNPEGMSRTVPRNT